MITPLGLKSVPGSHCIGPQPIPLGTLARHRQDRQEWLADPRGGLHELHILDLLVEIIYERSHKLDFGFLALFATSHCASHSNQG